MVDSLEYIAATTRHIPAMSFQSVRYHGWYSNRMRGDRKKREMIEPETDQPVEELVIDMCSFFSKA